MEKKKKKSMHSQTPKITSYRLFQYQRTHLADRSARYMTVKQMLADAAQSPGGKCGDHVT